MHEGRVGGIRPELFGPEAHVVGRLVRRLHAVGVRIGKRIGRRLADDDAGLAADVARHAAMAGNVVDPDPHPVAGLEALALRHVRAARRARRRERKRSLGPALQLLLRDDSLLDAERREAGQGSLVVAGGEIVARLHALDGVAILVHVEDAELDREREQGIDPLLPGLVEGLGLQRIANAAKSLLAAKIVHAVHASGLF